MSLKLNSSGGGSITLQEPVTASARTLTLPDNTGTVVSTASTGIITQAMMATNVAGNGPAFSAYSSANTSISSGVFTKVPFAIEEFDTNSNYDTSTYRFTPTVAGYYQINSGVYVYTTGATTSIRSILLYKNGGSYKRGSNFVTTPPNEILLILSCVAYCNGTTDYLEVYTYDNGTTPTIYGGGGSTLVWINGFLARAA